MLSRLGEVAVGYGAEVIVLWLLLPRAIGELEAARDAGGADGASGEVLRRRRDLQFELHGNQYAAEDAAYDLPEWTARRWPRHLEIQSAGYSALSRRG